VWLLLATAAPAHATGDEPEAAGWHRLGRVPADAITPDRAVWTGRDLVIWDAGTSSAVAFDPRTGSRRRLPKSPLRPRGAVVMAWTGDEVLVWGGARRVADCDGPTPYLDGAAYNPRSNDWRRIPDAPIAPRIAVGAAWTGRELIVTGGGPAALGRAKSVDSVRRDGAAYDPSTNRWRRIPPSPVKMTTGDVRWTGTEMLVVGSLRTDYCRDAYISNTRAVLYNPNTDRWRRLGDESVSGAFPLAAVVDGEILVTQNGHEPRVHELDGATWHDIASADIPDLECYASLAERRNSALLSICGHFWRFADNSWTALPSPWVPSAEQPWGEPIWTGRGYLFWQKNPWLPEGARRLPTADPGGKDLVVWAYVPPAR